jgi:hypothetical protein
MTKIVYPAGPVTPHGKAHIRRGDLPMVSLMSPNGQIVLWLMGGQSIADPYAAPECVQINRDGGLTGLIPPWQSIEQQGATEDGSTFVDALYGPMDITAKVTAIGRDAQNTRRVVRHLFEALDVKQQSELGWMTHEMGYWWAPVRWQMRPPDKFSGTPTRQQWTLQLRANSAFWQSYPDLDEFGFLYEDMYDDFGINYSGAQNLGPNWPQLYAGNGVGYHYADGQHCAWSDDPDRLFFTGTRRVIAGPYKDYSTPTDEQEISITFGNSPQFTLGSGAANDIWARMGRNVDGSWDGNGIRARIGWGYIRLSVFRAFDETVLASALTLFPPIQDSTFTLKCLAGQRRFQMRVSGWPLNLFNVTDTYSMMGGAYRGVGFGMQGGASVYTQATPGKIRYIDVNGEIFENFNTNYSPGCGPNWPLRYEGFNDAYIRVHSQRAEWIDNSGTETQVVVNGPYKDFETATDNQVVTMILGSHPQWSAQESGANDIWARMGRNEDGTWDGNGIRARCTRNRVTITAFSNFAEIWSRETKIAITPHPGDKWTLVAGYADDSRLFTVQRNGAKFFSVKELGTASHIGSNYRGIGFGVRAGGSSQTQATPAIVRRIAAGDNADFAQTGFLERHNAGDQPAYDEYTCYGPGTFSVANGPNSTDMVEFGPLAVGEIAHIRTDPRNKAVFDYSTITGAETPSALFGASPSDTMYRKLKGRFTTECAIPPKEPGMRVRAYSLKVSIRGGNADSKIMAALTPLRRYPQ